jgi:hypothetical protein
MSLSVAFSDSRISLFGTQRNCAKIVATAHANPNPAFEGRSIDFQIDQNI